MSGLKEAYVEMITTRGVPEPGSRDPRACHNCFFAFAIPFVWITTPNEGLDLIVSQQQRIPPQSVNPRVKNYHWLDLVMGQFEAYDRGGNTVAVVNGNGNIAEGPGFNIFAVKNEVLTTPAEGVLEGVTRKTAIELARELGYLVLLEELSPEAARCADELFATSTAGGIMAITKIDGQNVSTGDIGLITQALQDRYWTLHDDPRYAYQIKY
jgi:branched-chain amino acid aminotransferase